MIHHGKLTNRLKGYGCYVSDATQEEAKRLSQGKEESGIILFFPVATGLPTDYVKRALVK